jgi:hypothetical protein
MRRLRIMHMRMMGSRCLAWCMSLGGRSNERCAVNRSWAQAELKRPSRIGHWHEDHWHQPTEDERRQNETDCDPPQIA